MVVQVPGLSNGIPSHDTFNTVLARLKPDQFECCLLSWITCLHDVTGGQILPIDGKTQRGSGNTRKDRSPLHMVSVWASQQHISLRSVIVDEKSNEITAVPKLLHLIEISGALVTIDAMGCQKEIAKKIVDGGGDYVLAVKDNQPKLAETTEGFFLKHMENDFADTPVRRHEMKEKGHGREEHRSYLIAHVPKDFPVQAVAWLIGDRHRHQ